MKEDEVVYWMRISTEIHAEACLREDVPDGATLISKEAYLWLRGKSGGNTDSIIRELVHAASEQDAKFQPTVLEMRYP